MNKIYLAGAIAGCSDSQCKDWREYVKNSLGNKFKYLDPMRRDYRGKELESVSKIVVGDKKDIRECDILLGNANNPSWGTGMEIIYAHHEGKTVFLVCDKERPSPWLIYHSKRIFKTLDTAIEYLKEL